MVYLLMSSSLLVTRSTSSALFPPLANLKATRTSLKSFTRKIDSSFSLSAYGLSNGSIGNLVQP